MDRILMRRALALAIALVSTSAPAVVGSSGANAASAPEIVISGVVRASGVPIPNADVMATFEQNATSLASRSAGGEVPTLVAGLTRADRAGRFTISVLPSAVPPESIDNGKVQLKLTAADATREI